MMGQRMVRAFLLLFCAHSATSFFFGCDKPGLENCNFQLYDRDDEKFVSTFCNWKSDGSINPYYFEDKPKNYFVGLDNDKVYGQLMSRETCSTEGETFCLRFKYNIRERDSDLSVNIKYDGSEETDAPIWLVSSSTGWDSARVPIKTHGDFKVVFKAQRHSEQPTTLQPVFIDEIAYEQKACTLFPRKATPPPTITTTTTSLPTTTTEGTTKRTTTEETTSAVSASTVIGERTNTSNTTDAESQQRSEASFEPSINIGLIVGVVVAVVVVIVIVLLLFTLFRRKHLEIWKTCFKGEQDKANTEASTSHTANYDISTGESFYENEADMNQAEKSQKRHFHARKSAETSDYYSVVSSQDEVQSPHAAEAAQYAVVHKPGKTAKGGTPKGSLKNNTTTNTMTTESHYYSSPSETEYNNIPFNTERQISNGTPSALVGTRANDGVYHILEGHSTPEENSVYYIPEEGRPVASKSQREVYNSLDFEGKGFRKENKESGPGTLYSHLNESVEGTYNEVDRQKREEVIDSEYSHIS